MPTLLHRLHEWGKTQPDSIAQRYKENGVWKPVTYKEFAQRVFYFGQYLRALGLQKDDVVAIFSYNRPQWPVADLAPGFVGALAAGLYPNSSPKDIAYIFKLTKAKVLCVQNKDYFQRLGGDDPTYQLPDHIKRVIVFEGPVDFSDRAISFEQALREGERGCAGRLVEKDLEAVNPHDGAFMVFTSGTTGEPKGAVITHDNLAYASDVTAHNWNLPRGEQSMFSFLPINHIAEKLQTVGVALSQGYVVNYCTSIDKFQEEVGEVQPSVLLCVPRVWEKIYEGVTGKIELATGKKKKLADAAFEIGARKAAAQFERGSFSLVDRLKHKVLHKLVLSKILKAIGMEHVKYAATGAAPLPPHVGKWFRSLGLDILEDYGQSESSAIICQTIPGVDCLGTVGKPVPGTQFLLAEDGEVLSKGRHIFKGYFKNEKSTKSTIKDGWLYTGDLAEKTDTGMIRIIGRKKEILKTSGGKIVAPLPIEEDLKASPWISQACVVGEARKYCTAIITISDSKREQVRERTNGGQTVEDSVVINAIQNAVDDVNSKLATYEQIKYFKVLVDDFSIENGEMTPTLKMKRKVVERIYRHLIDEMYE